MNNKTWFRIIQGILATFVLYLLCVFAYNYFIPAKIAVPVKLPPANAIVPLKVWLDGYRVLKQKQDELNHIIAQDGIQERQDYINGLATRLQNMIPPGYTFDESTMSFVPVPPTPVQQPQSIPLPTSKKP